MRTDAGRASVSRTGTVEIVVVSYGKPDMVISCVRSVRRHGGTDIPVHVVDNCSPDDTADRVAAACPDVHLVRRSGNDGFGVANNVVLRKVTSDYVLLLNPDAELDEGTLDHLLGVMGAQPDIGIAGCRLLTADGSLDHAAKRNIPDPWTAARYFALRLVGKRGSGYLAPDVDPLGTGDVDAVNGAFMLVRTAAMREVGYFDEAYWMYGEDLDWCVRFADAGWRVFYDGTVTARHIKGGAAGGTRPLRLNYHFHKSMQLFYDKHLATGNPVKDALVRAGIWARFGVVTVANGAGLAWQRAAARRSGASR